ncbi:MAG TPA: hypothetical protein VHY76_06995 [Acetobacteraceae bacterium]|nr:hypothetical protein [Acetobacteraceae bacterium]
MSPRRPVLLAPALLGALLLAVAGCSESNSLAATFGPAPHVPFRGDPYWYDGSYQGRARLVHATIPNCPPTRYGVLEVGDATLVFAYAPDLIFTVPVTADGTLSSTGGPAKLEGKIVGRHLDMTVATTACQTRFDMNMVWNRG